MFGVLHKLVSSPPFSNSFISLKCPILLWASEPNGFSYSLQFGSFLAAEQARHSTSVIPL